jgi:hypothetical protein
MILALWGSHPLLCLVTRREVLPQRGMAGAEDTAAAGGCDDRAVRTLYRPLLKI